MNRKKRRRRDRRRARRRATFEELFAEYWGAFRFFGPYRIGESRRLERRLTYLGGRKERSARRRLEARA
jgi:hypothetical protein